MIRTLRKPLWRWEPAPYLLLIVLAAVTVSISPNGAPVAYWTLLTLTVVVAAIAVTLLVVSLVRGRSNPDSAGMLSGIDDLELVPLDAGSAPATPVADTNRHRAALESVAARAVGIPTAVLVPDATRWLGLRIRIAVHLVVPGKVYHVGFLPEQATVAYTAGLRALAARRRFVSPPVRSFATDPPYKLELDLGALSAVLEQRAA